MNDSLTILQIITSVGLILSILLQARGSGLSATFGGDSSVYRTKRGAEKFLFYLTIFFAILFLSSSLASVILKG